MQTWGESGIVKVAGKVKSKLKLQGEVGMFVGYVNKGASDTYHMYLAFTKQEMINGAKECSMHL
jgi:hypothetical protein